MQKKCYEKYYLSIFLVSQYIQNYIFLIFHFLYLFVYWRLGSLNLNFFFEASKYTFNNIIRHYFPLYEHLTLHKKWSFPLRISSVNVTKSAASCGFGHIYWRNP